jgi:SET domain-containing protein
LRGIFCAHPLTAGDVIEICPVIVLPGHEKDLLAHSLLYEYYYLWGERQEQCAIALGYGSLYNHAVRANADFTPDYNDDTIIFTALRDIEPGEEITIDYQGGRTDHALWF